MSLPLPANDNLPQKRKPGMAMSSAPSPAKRAKGTSDCSTTEAAGRKMNSIPSFAKEYAATELLAHDAKRPESGGGYPMAKATEQRYVKECRVELEPPPPPPATEYPQAVRNRSNPLETISQNASSLDKRIAAEAAVLSISKEEKHSPSLVRRLVSGVVSVMTASFWFVLNHFSRICVAVLVFMALWPDYYFQLDLTPARLLLGLALMHISQSWWYSMPKWFRKYAKTQRDSGDDDNPDGDGVDFTSPNTIIEKLQQLFDLTYQQLDECSALLPQFKIYVCALALFDLMRELYHAFPDWHDEKLRRDGSTSLSVDLQTLAKYLELSDLAYEESRKELTERLCPMGYLLIRHDVDTTEPGRVGHFIAVNHSMKEAVVSIKGTSSVGDVLTDLVGGSIPHALQKSSTTGKEATVIHCHEGMYTATTTMLDDTKHILEHFIVPAGYSVSICGHSLGAGVSCLLGTFLKDAGIPNLQVYAFATPACLSYEAALACQDYVTSVVNNADCIPRVSLMTIKTLFQFFLKIDSKLEQIGMSPKDWRSTKAFLSEVASVDSDPLFTLQEMQEFRSTVKQGTSQKSDINAAADGNRHNLFVPGKVLHMWECNAGGFNDAGDDGKCDGSKIMDCREGHGGLDTLLELQVSTSMLSDHGTESYKQNLKALMSMEKQ